MAVETSLPALLETLTQSLSAADGSVPDVAAILPPTNGISLLDVKNELLLSYLQHVVFLIILKLRHYQNSSSEIDNDVILRLVELRLYLEKGVRPLEGRLKYQIDKVLRAANDAARSELDQHTKDTIVESSESGVSEGEDSENESDDADNSDFDDLQYRPNPASLKRLLATDSEDVSRSDGVYRPPRISATAMPTTIGSRNREDRRPQKSATLDEFISTELSSAPLAEPSIGSTILQGGRKLKSDRERAEEAERREYEEKHFVRLPKPSKTDRKKNSGRNEAGYGGEEWRELGSGLDRIDRLTKRKDGAARGALEKSRKRAVEDGPRDSGGPEVGQRFQKRVKTMDRGRKDRGRK